MTRNVLDIRAQADRWIEQLADQGYCIIPDLVDRLDIAALQRDLAPTFDAAPFCEGFFYGERTKRFGSLLRRSAHAEALVMQPVLLAIADAILGKACDRIQMNVAQAIEIHPGALCQVPHRDHDMWQGEKGGHEYLLNVIWPLTPFTAGNGATQIYPGSHGAEGMARERLTTPVIAECQPGSAICFLGSTLHGAGGNDSSAVRQAVVFGYSLGWLKPYENLWLAYPPEVARNFSPELAAMVGYAQHRPNLGNYEGRCPSILLRDDAPSLPAAIDTLRPDQSEMIAGVVAQQNRGDHRPWLMPYSAG
jgi:ectoine hydroxylase-related dioxygenase (phytanoyl-CoA dioxygenase family)